MAGEKVEQSYSINTDHQVWLRQMVEKYKLKDEGKAMRIILDHAMTIGDEETLFKKVRCLRCGRD